MGRKEIIRTIYLYIFSVVGLVLIVIGCVRLSDLALKKYIFKKAEESIMYPSYPVKTVPAPDGKTTEQVLTQEEQDKFAREQKEAEEKQRESQRARTASESIAMILVGTPLFFYHWKTIQNDRKS